MLSAVYTECRVFYCYAECHYAECRYAECRGAKTQYYNSGANYLNKFTLVNGGMALTS